MFSLRFYKKMTSGIFFVITSFNVVFTISDISHLVRSVACLEVYISVFLLLCRLDEGHHRY